MKYPTPRAPVMSPKSTSTALTVESIGEGEDREIMVTTTNAHKKMNRRRVSTRKTMLSPPVLPRRAVVLSTGSGALALAARQPSSSATPRHP